MNRFTILSAFLLIISGCTGIITLKDVDPASLSANQAVLIFSAGADSPCKHNTAQMILKESSQPASLLSGTAVFQMNNGYVKSDFSVDYAKVLSVVVKPGVYDFWADIINPFLGYKSPVFTKSFEIQPQETLYIGEVFTLGCGGTIEIEIKDKQARDIDYIVNKYPSIQEIDIKVRLLELIL